MKLINTDVTFSKTRLFLWPIHRYELKKFLPIAGVLLCLLFNYSILRNTKDVLVAGAPGSGPEIIPYLKSLFVMPSMVLFSYFYARYAYLFSAEKLFYLIITSFLLYFVVFCFCLYPIVNIIHPSNITLQSWQKTYPHFRYLFSVFGIWSFSLFYILAELWGSVTIVLLFWQFSNSVISTTEAKRFYPLYALIANGALILSGTVIVESSQIRAGISHGIDPWELTLKYLGFALLLSGTIAMILYRWLNVSHTSSLKNQQAPQSTIKKTKSSGSFILLCKSLMSSSYLRLLALIVLGYGISINLVEIIWKKQLAMHYAGDQNGYNAFMGRFSQVTGIATILISFLAKGVIRRFGWFIGAIACPIVLAITGTTFISLIIFQTTLSPYMLAVGYSATFVAAIVGAAQNILSKGVKYALFDPSKEMAYIPLETDLRVQGKAVVDINGGIIGKASGAYIILALLTITGGDIITITPYLVIAFLLILAIWMFGVARLNKEYQTLVTTKENSSERDVKNHQIAA